MNRAERKEVVVKSCPACGGRLMKFQMDKEPQICPKCEKFYGKATHKKEIAKGQQLLHFGERG